MTLMMSGQVLPRFRLLRNFGLIILAASFVATSVSFGDVAAAESPSRFMQRVANKLISAQRKGSRSAFETVIRSHADLPSIGMYSLGQYRKRLRSEDKQPYYSGVVNFMAQYVIKESPKYPVLKAVVIGQTKETRKGVYVDSVVKLRDGGSYDVRWWLIRRGSTFKVGDAQVLGFWGREQLKRLFEGYIQQNNGNPRKLVAALSTF